MIDVDLDKINEQLGCTSREHGRRVGPYSVFFGGFFASPENDWLIGAVKAWPGPHSRQSDFDLHGGPKYFINIIRGRACGRYAPGSYWDIRPVGDLRHFSVIDFKDPEMIRQAQIEIERAFLIVEEMVRVLLDGTFVPMIPSVRVIAVDEFTGEVINGKTVPRHSREVLKERDGKYVAIKQEIRWVDL